MAKQNTVKPNKHTPKSLPEVSRKQLYVMAFVIALIGFLVYSNTFDHKYVLDDYPTIKENKLTKKGFDGISEIFKHSYWYGNDSKDDWLYRPLSVAMFAVEWEFWPDNPSAGHIINVILYALTGFLLFFTLKKMLGGNPLIPFVASLLFIVHPLHTEVIANIKSRDEILTFIFFLISLNTLLSYGRKQHLASLIISLVSFFLALMAKESAITYLFVFPLALFYYCGNDIKKSIITTLFFGVIAAIYMYIRGSVLEKQLLGDVVSIVDNTVVKSDYPHRLATAMVIIGTYVKLLFVPYPLVYDYSFSTFKIVGLDSPWAWISILIYAYISFYIIKNIFKKSTIVFSLVIYLLHVMLVANIFFLTRSTAAERFLYQPTLGFSLIVALLLARYTKTDTEQNTFTDIKTMITKNSTLFLIVGGISILFAYATYNRAYAWKDNFTLFSTDLKNIPNSARAQYSYANDLTQMLVKDSIPTAAEREKAYNEAFAGLNKALQIHEGYFEPYFALGQLHAYKKDFPKSIELYKRAMFYNKDYHYLYNNIGNNYYRIGQLDTAMKYLNRAIELHPDYAEAYSNIGSVYFTKGMRNEAIQAYNKAIEYDAKYYDAYKNMGSTYGMMADYPKAMEYFNKALSIKSTDPDLYRFIAITYQNMGDANNAKIFTEKEAQLRQAKNQ